MDTKFKVGDRLVITDFLPEYNGKKGTIISFIGGISESKGSGPIPPPKDNWEPACIVRIDDTNEELPFAVSKCSPLETE